MDNTAVELYGKSRNHRNRLTTNVNLPRFLIILCLLGSCIIVLFLLRDKVWGLDAYVLPADCDPGQSCVIPVSHSAQRPNFAPQIAKSFNQRLHSALAPHGSQISINTQSEHMAISNQAANKSIAYEPYFDRPAQGENIDVQISALPDSHAFEIEIGVSNLLRGHNDGLNRPDRVWAFTYDRIIHRAECGPCDELSPNMVRHINVMADITAGLVLYEKEALSEAIQKFLTALYCSGEDLATYHSSTSTALDLLEVQPACRPLRVPYKSLAPVYYYTAKSLALNGYYEHAIFLFKKAIAASPHEPANWISLSQTQLRWTWLDDDPIFIDYLAKAQTSLDNLEKTLPAQSKPFVPYNRGLLAELKGNTEEANEYFEAALVEANLYGSEKYEILFALARTHHSLGDDETANSLMQQAMVLFPNSPWPHLSLAQNNQANRLLANYHLEQATLLTPAYPYVFVKQAELCQIWGDLPCIEEAYLQALAVRPDSGWLSEKLGDLYLEMAMATPDQSPYYLEKAVDAYRTSALILRPEDPWTQERYAYALLATEAYAEAAEAYQRAIGLSHVHLINPRLYCSLGIAYQQLSDNEAAQAAVQKCKEPKLN